VYETHVANQSQQLHHHPPNRHSICDSAHCIWIAQTHNLLLSLLVPVVLVLVPMLVLVLVLESKLQAWVWA
jgi:hypothetical protein